MDEEKMKHILGERFKALPQPLQDAILSVDFREELATIAEKYELLIDQAGKLEDETVLVMMGFAGTAEFEENLATELNISETEAGDIVRDVNEHIFLPIRGAMQKLGEHYGTRKEEAASDAPKEKVGAEHVEPDQAGALAELEKEAKQQETKPNFDTHADPVLESRLGSAAAPKQKAEETEQREVGQSSAEQKRDPYREPIDG